MTGSGAAARNRNRRSVPLWFETILLVGVALLVSAVIKTFFVQMFFVPSGSMRPLFVDDDRIMVEKMSYWGEQPVRRGDVVVFADPGGRWLGSFGQLDLNPAQSVLSRVGLYPTGGHLVKRVIGVGGDRVQCCDTQGRVEVNGVALTERPYIMRGFPPSDTSFNVRVPEDRLWVMGDNRSNSEDSRFHQDLPGGGTVPASGVVGRVWGIVWPVRHWTALDRPSTFDNPELRAAEASAAGR